MKKKKPNPIALLPIVVFLVLYLGVGIYFVCRTGKSASTIK